MKTLKRTLCLVLALVLCLGTLSVASAAYPDEDQIDENYAEAVEVMSALGILEGMKDGNFAPKEALNRAQAAKILCYMIFGRAAADLADGCEESAFVDVAPTYWAAGYINALYDAGIVCGTGDGKFSPTKKLTGYEWGKMVLGAMGYDAEECGFEAHNKMWKTNVEIALHKAELDEKMNDEFTVAGPIAREEAAQLAFYAMLDEYVGEGFIGLEPAGDGWKLVIKGGDIESLADENWALEAAVGYVIEYADGYYLDGTNNWGYSVEYDLTEDVADLEGRHVYAWFAWDMDADEMVQITDVNVIDSWKPITVADLATLKFEGTVDFYMNNKFIKYIDSSDFADKTAAEKANTLKALSALYNLTLFAYDWDGDGNVDDILAEAWFVGEKDGKLFSYTPDWYEYNTEKYTNYAHPFWAAAAAYMIPEKASDVDYLAGPFALQEVDATLDNVTVYNKALPFLTFNTSAGDLDVSYLFYNDFENIYDSEWEFNGKWYNAWDKYDYETQWNEYYGFNYKFFLDPAGKVVAYEIADTTEFVAYISDFYYTESASNFGHNGVSKSATVFAHGVDLDGNIVDIPVAAGVADGAAEVANLMKNAKMVAYFKLTSDGTYRFEKYANAMYVNITNAAKYVWTGWHWGFDGVNFNFLDTTDIFNVSEANGVIDVEKLDAPALYNAWIVWGDEDTDKRDVTVTDIFYDDYTFLQIDELFIPRNTTVVKVTAADDIHFIEAYLDGEKVVIPVSFAGFETRAFNKALSDGGFYEFKFIDGIYQLIPGDGDYTVEKISNVYLPGDIFRLRAWNDNRPYNVGDPDYYFADYTFVDLRDTTAPGYKADFKAANTLFLTKDGVKNADVVYVVDAIGGLK